MDDQSLYNQRKNSPKKVLLCILDGWGIAAPSAFNAIGLSAPHWAEMLKKHPHTQLQASEGNVGLPDGQIGNSEVGHMTIGLGRIEMQSLPLINKSIKDQALNNAQALVDLIAKLKQSGGVCHIMGMLSGGGVHSHQQHIWALGNILQDAGIKVMLHVFLDGRDTSPKVALESLKLTPDNLTIATVSGRYYAMDRDNRWERTGLAYQAIVNANVPGRARNALEAVESAYGQDITDEFIKPCVIGDYQGMKDGDGLIMANFRADRVKQLLSVLVKPSKDVEAMTGEGSTADFNYRPIKWAKAIGMAEYYDDLTPYAEPIFKSFATKNGLGEVVSNHGLKQLRVSETEKYNHVTYFFNGKKDAPYTGESRILIPSPKVATYDLCPEMSAELVKDAVLKAIRESDNDLIVVNFANPDMVGHTGNLAATQAAIATVDGCLREMEDAVMADSNWSMVITADHGNCEQMQDESGEIHTAHTCNPVPFMLVGLDEGYKVGEYDKNDPYGLADIAPTVLTIMGIDKPTEMTGRSIVTKR